MITRRRSRHNSTNNYSKVHDTASNDDVRYFIEKIKNKSLNMFSGNTPNPASNPDPVSDIGDLGDKPQLFKNYIHFLARYVRFTLSNITDTYDVIVSEWMAKNPFLADKIKFVDSSNIKSVISNNIIDYAERKLRPGIINSVINRTFTDDGASKIWVNMETYNPPALAFLGPPGTAKTNAITSALASLAKGGENRLIWDWLRYDITTHEVTTAPLVLPVASDVVTDNPLTTVALMRSTGNREIDIALTENIQTKTLSKAIATFAYILKGGHENKLIELRPEVQQQLNNNVVLSSLKLETWKFVTTENIDANNIDKITRPLIDALNTRLKGFKAIVEAIDRFAKNNQRSSDLIDYIVSGQYLDQSVKNRLAVAEKYANDFRELCHLLSDLIVFGLTPVIADTFMNFFMNMKESKNNKEKIENGVMYIYHKIHNDYLHRIISRIFILYALFNISKEQKKISELFTKLISTLQDGLENMLQEYVKWILSENDKEYYDLEAEYKNDIQDIGKNKYMYYDKFNKFLLKMELNNLDERYRYRKIDALFIENVVSRFDADIKQMREFSATSQGYKTSKIAAKSYDRVAEGGSDRHFGANRLSFVDEISIITDTINDVDEINRYYSNSPNPDLRTTAQRLGDSFGRRFLNLADNDASTVSYHLSVVFSFINTLVQLFNADAGEIEWELADYKKEISRFKSSLETLFRKSLSIITINPKIGFIMGNENSIEEPQSKNIDIFEIIADYVLARLGVVESVYTPGAVYSFPAPIQVFLKKARDSYIKVLNETKIDLDKPNSNVRLPMYVLFIDEILTKLTKQDFTFWLNIWNGLVSPNTDINQALPPNVCFIVAGNMPKDWRLLEQALLQRAVVELQQPEDEGGTKTSYGPSEDTLNALGSRINLYIVTYDYSYLMRTDDSTIKQRTNLFITSLVDKVLKNEFSNKILLDTAINIIGGFYDYYKVIVSKRLSAVKEQNNEELARLHAYIASLTARANITPYDINNVEHNRTILQLINLEHVSNITSTTYKDILDKATKLNYLFNSTVFGKSIYKHMLLDYFKSNKYEAIYFKRMITLVLSPVVLHLSFLHAYLTWNNMMRNIADDLFNMGSNVFDADKASYYENIMKIIKDSAVLINFNITTEQAMYDKLELMTNNDYKMDRIFDLIFERKGSIDFGKVLSESKDIRYCHPYVGAFIGLLTIAFYNYIKYMKKFNPNISNSILSLWDSIKNNIENSLGKNNLAKNNFYVLGININNYFIDKDRKIKDIIFEKSKKNSDNAVEIKVIAFDKDIYQGELETSSGVVKMPYERKGLVYTDAIAVKIQKTGEGDNDINEKDIDAIKALVEYTFYTYVYKMREGNFDSASLVNYVLGSSSIPTPIVRNLMASFFNSPKEGHAFTVEPLREMDRWFTNVSSSVVRYVTIMFILKHILTYEQDESNNNKSNLVVSFINSIKANMDRINSNVKNDFDALIREFASLLYRYREAVFTPLAGDNQEFRMFSYDYYSTSGTSKEYDGYYMNPRNLINFGDLSFISKNLKGLDIIQVISGDEGRYIQEIAAKFVNNLKEKDTIPTTFLPIHLVAHLNNQQVTSPTTTKINLLSGSIVRLVLGLVGKGYIEQDAFRFLLDPTETQNDPRIDFYEITDRNCQICDIVQVLSNNLKHIDKEQFQDLAPIIQELLDINSIIQTTWNGKNLIQALEATNEGYENIQTALKAIDDGIFTELRRSQRKYPSVKKYLDLWDHKETQKNIKDFFDNMLVVLRKKSADKDTYYANKLINTLNTYIQQAAQKIDGMIELDENNKALQKIKNLLSTLKKDSSQLDENIKSEIASIIDKIYEDSSKTLIEIRDYRNEVIERNFKILNPLIKYGFAILLSNMLLKIQYGELQDYLTNIDYSFKASYKKVSSIDDYEDKEYFNIFVRYMFYDINRRDIGDKNKEIDIDVQLVVRHEPITSSSSVNGIPLVTPVFTGSKHGKANVELEGNTINGRRVYTQYEYIENDKGIPNLYCDVHHMPIKGTRDVDGFLHKVETTIDIASNDKDAKSGKKHIAYKDLMFLRDWAEPRYAFAPSALVNALLIIGTYLVQNTLLGDKVDLKFVNRFLPFVITNMYEYYKDAIEANGTDKAGVERILKNISENIYKRPIHPLVAAITLALNRDDEKIKERLKEDYAIRESNESNTYSRRDSFMRDLRLRFYSVQKVSAVNYNMYSLYEPGIVIMSEQQSQNEQHA